MQPFSYDLGALWRGEVLRRINEAQLTAAARNDPVPGRTAVRPGGRESGRWWAIRPLRRVEAPVDNVQQSAPASEPARPRLTPEELRNWHEG